MQHRCCLKLSSKSWRYCGAQSNPARKAKKVMEYVNFGKAGVQVSRLALGLGFRGQGDEAEAQRVIEHTIAQGLT